MRGFHPTIRTIHPPPPADPAGVAVSTALSRDIGFRLTWDLPTVLLSGILTAGLMPLIILLLRWRRFATSDVFQLEHVVEWLDQQHRPTVNLHGALARVRSTITPLVFLGFGFAGVSFAVAIVHIWMERFSGSGMLALFTLYYPAGLSAVYMLVLSVGFIVCHWGAIHLHAHRIRNFGKEWNASNPLDSDAPLSCPPRVLVPTAPWLLAGIGLLLAGCVWGLPMMLAAGAHKRYISDMARRIRTPMAERIRQLAPGEAHVSSAGVD